MELNKWNTHTKKKIFDCLSSNSIRNAKLINCIQKVLALITKSPLKYKLNSLLLFLQTF